MSGLDFTNHPTLFIGLGGAGCSPLACLRAAVTAEVGGDPSGTDFLFIDTVDLRNQHPSIRDQVRSPVDYLTLGGFDPHTFVAHHRGTGTEEGRDLTEWLDFQMLRHVPQGDVSDGASRQRQMGRLCLYFHRHEFDQRVSRKLRSTIDASRNAAGSAALGDKLEPRVVIAAGSCGGTGSGTFLDAAYRVRLVLRDLGYQAAEVWGLLAMPTIFVEANRLVHPALVPLYQANAFAFLAEVDHFLAHPEEVDASLAFDRASARRAAGNGIASGLNEFINRVFLVDATIPTLGTFSDFGAYFRYSGLGLLEALRPNRAAGMEAVLNNVENRLAGRDAQGRPRRYCAFGHGQIELPTDLAARYLGVDYARRVVEAVLGERGGGGDGDYAALRGGLEQQFLEPTEEHLRRLGEDVLADLPGVTRLCKPGTTAVDSRSCAPGRVDMLQQEVEELINEAINDLAEQSRGHLERAREGLAERVDGLIRGAWEGRGLRPLTAALQRLDNAWESRQRQIASELGSLSHRLGAVEDRMQSARSDMETGRSRLIGGGRLMEDGARAWVRALHERAGMRLEGERLRQTARLLYHLAGPSGGGKVELEERDAVNAALIRKVRADSVLDARKDRLLRLKNAGLATLLDGLQERLTTARSWDLEPLSPTVRRQPALGSVAALAKYAESTGALEGAFPGLTAAVGAQRRLVLDALEAGGVDLLAAAAERDPSQALRPLVEALVRQGVAGARGALPRDMESRLNDLEERGRGELGRTLFGLATEACALSSAYARGDESPVSLVTGHGSGAAFELLGVHLDPRYIYESGADEVHLFKLLFAFPLRAVPALHGLEGAYGRRNRRQVFPHVERRMNEEGVPQMGGAASLRPEDPALRWFLLARAVTDHLFTEGGNLAVRPQDRAELLRDLGFPLDDPYNTTVPGLLAQGREGGRVVVQAARLERSGEHLKVIGAQRIEGENLAARVRAYGVSEAMSAHRAVIEALGLEDSDPENRLRPWALAAVRAFEARIQAGFAAIRSRDPARARELAVAGRVLRDVLAEERGAADADDLPI